MLNRSIIGGRINNNITVGVVVIAALTILEVISLFPFSILIKVIMGQDLVRIDRILIELIGRENLQRKLVILSLISIFLSTIFSMAAIYINSKIIWNSNHSISTRLFHGMIKNIDPFSKELNEAKLKKNIATEVQQYSVYGIGALVNFMGRSIGVSIILFGLAITIEKKVLYSIVFLVIISALANRLLAGVVKKIGQERERSATQIFENMDQTLGILPTIKSLKNASYFRKKFEISSRKFNNAATSFMVLPAFPRIIIEAIIFTSVTIILFFQEDASKDALSEMIFPLIAALKLMPSIATIFRNLTEIKFSEASKREIEKEILEYKEDSLNYESVITEKLPKNLSINIEFNRELLGLSSLNIKIEDLIKGDVIVFWGRSGLGKSTLLQVISGVSKRVYMKISVSANKEIIEDLSRYKIAYLTQKNSLITGSLKENITLGCDYEDEEVREIMNLVGLRHFDNKMDVPITNLNSHFSGGEIQRIALARCLITAPDVLFIDEPTSALDAETTRTIKTTLENLKTNQKMIIFLATHSLELKGLATKVINL